MFLRWFGPVCLGALLSGCAVGGLAARSVVTAGAAESIAIRGAVSGAAAGRTVAGVGSRAIASRMIVSEPLLGAAAERGALRDALYQLTSAGTRPAMLAVEHGGLIRAGANPLARLNPATGEILAEGRVHGILADGYLFEVNRGVRGEAIAQLRGLMSSRSAPIVHRTAGPFSIRRDLVVEVIRIENGRYLIRLPTGALEWAGPEVVALLLIGIAGDPHECVPGEGVLVRTDGASLAFRVCKRSGETYVITTASGEILVDASEVSEILPGALDVEAGRTAVAFKDGSTIYGLVEQSGDSYLIFDEGGGLVIADRLAVERIGKAQS